ncbi:MAG: tetratricopeptide repeat protein [Bdellovibrio sp.]
MNGNRVNDSEKNWLVKSSTRILGPFTLAELTEQIRARHVSIIDEIKQPDGRWSYVRENKIFLDIVKNIREEQDAAPENTMTQSIAQHTTTTTTRTDSIITEDHTLTPISASLESAAKLPVQENIKDITPSAVTPAAKPSAVSKGPTKNYGAAGDSRVKNKLQKKSNMWRWIFTTASIAVAAVVALTLFQKSRKKTLTADELLSQAVRYKALGLYEKSLASYQKASQVKEPAFDIQVQMAPVLISEDRQTLAGRRVLEKALIQEGLGRSGNVEAHLGIAVSYIMDGDFKQAEDMLQKALGYEPLNQSALLNLGMIHLKNERYQEAMGDFDSIYRKNAQSTLALFGKALATIELNKKYLNPYILQSLINDLKIHLQKSLYLRQELLLFYVYAHHLLNDVDGLNQAVVQFLNQIPGQTKKFVHPLDVEWRSTQWEFLEKYCNEIYTKQTPNPELKALRAVCLMEINRDVEAAKLMQEALDEAPRDPYVLATQAGYLSKIGRYPEAITVLKTPELSTLPIKNLLLGDICIKKQDLNCVRDSYGQIYEKDPLNALALSGLAWVSKQSHNRAKAFDYVNAGLQAEPNFLPLLELRDQLESE